MDKKYVRAREVRRSRFTCCRPLSRARARFLLNGPGACAPGFMLAPVSQVIVGMRVSYCRAYIYPFRKNMFAIGLAKGLECLGQVGRVCLPLTSIPHDASEFYYLFFCHPCSCPVSGETKCRQLCRPA